MRLRILSFLLLLVAALNALASDLYATINGLRAGEGHCSFAERLPPLQPRAELERVAEALARGNGLEQSLRAAGYRATRSNALRFAGDVVGAQLAEMLAQLSYCRQLQDAAVTEVGIYLDAHQVWIVMAAPFAPLLGMSERSAGRRVLDLVNQTRATPRNCGNRAFDAARPVRWSDSLAAASRAHSEDMAHHSYFSHGGHDGTNPAQRVERAGYRYRTIGENIAGGQLQPEDAMSGWINSPRHCANLMNPAFTEMGVAFSVDRKSEMGVYWTQVFGAPR